MSYIHNNIIDYLLNQTKSLFTTTLYVILIIVTIVYFNYFFLPNYTYDWQIYFKENKFGKSKNKKQFIETQKIKPY